MPGGIDRATPGLPVLFVAIIFMLHLFPRLVGVL